MSTLTPTTPSTPPGYKADAKGRLIPLELVAEVDQLRDQLVQDVANRAIEMSAALSAFKAWSFQEIEAFVDISAERFGMAIGGKKGNISLMSFDGKYKLTIAVADRLAFDERLQIAKGKVDSCILRWSEGSRPEMVALIQDAFQVDKAGQVSTWRILALRKLVIDDPEWKEAMAALGESIQTVSSKTYIRVYERQANGEYRSIPLEITGV